MTFSDDWLVISLKRFHHEVVEGFTQPILEADLARQLAAGGRILVDEFTSVLDRALAAALCISVESYVPWKGRDGGIWCCLGDLFWGRVCCWRCFGSQVFQDWFLGEFDVERTTEVFCMSRSKANLWNRCICILRMFCSFEVAFVWILK